MEKGDSTQWLLMDDPEEEDEDEDAEESSEAQKKIKNKK